MSVKIYHNPRCGKSRQTLQLLKEQGIEPVIIEYLKTPPTAQELNDILQKLGLEPRELMRKKETEYKANGLDDPALDRQALISGMINHPILIERPIVIANDKAAYRPCRRKLYSPFYNWHHLSMARIQGRHFSDLNRIHEYKTGLFLHRCIVRLFRPVFSC